VARTALGDDALVCLGSTRAEVVAAAWARPRAELPDAAVRLVIECWQGGRLAGRWQEVRPDRGELPRLPRPRRGMRRSGLVSPA
jgi:hypothetical protein